MDIIEKAHQLLDGEEEVFIFGKGGKMEVALNPPRDLHCDIFVAIRKTSQGDYRISTAGAMVLIKKRDAHHCSLVRAVGIAIISGNKRCRH